MKKILVIVIALTSLLATLTFTSCKQNAEQTSSENEQTVYQSYATQLEYYISLAGKLQDELIAEKEENFIAECSYQLEIKDLQKEIDLLKRQIDLYMTSSSENKNIAIKDFENTSLEDLFAIEIVGNKLTVASYLGNEKDVSIPQTVNGIAVKAIGDEAFKGSDVVRVVIPDGVEKIDWFAFSACRSLREIVIPATVTSVEYGAFDYCSPSLVIICEKGSYIEAYAKSWGITVVNE